MGVLGHLSLSSSTPGASWHFQLVCVPTRRSYIIICQNKKTPSVSFLCGPKRLRLRFTSSLRAFWVSQSLSFSSSLSPSLLTFTRLIALHGRTPPPVMEQRQPECLWDPCPPSHPRISESQPAARNQRANGYFIRTPSPTLQWSTEPYARAFLEGRTTELQHVRNFKPKQCCFILLRGTNISYIYTPKYLVKKYLGPQSGVICIAMYTLMYAHKNIINIAPEFEPTAGERKSPES